MADFGKGRNTTAGFHRLHEMKAAYEEKKKRHVEELEELEDEAAKIQRLEEDLKRQVQFDEDLKEIINKMGGSGKTPLEKIEEIVKLAQSASI